jgi:G:T-mismatch repair DNA endonuclease (very short patch repair protein)
VSHPKRYVNKSPNIVSNECMEAHFIHGYMAYATKCLITMENPSQDRQHYLAHIQALPGKNERVFNPLRASKPPHRRFEHVIEIEEG